VYTTDAPETLHESILYTGMEAEGVHPCYNIVFAIVVHIMLFVSTYTCLCESCFRGKAPGSDRSVTRITHVLCSTLL